MYLKNKLIEAVLAGQLMSRADQDDAYRQYQDYSYSEDGPKLPDNLHIFYTYYECEYYEGYGFVVGYDSDKNEFFYNSGSHCSCYGLEGQWEPEEYTYDQLVAYVERMVKNDEKDYTVALLNILKGEF